MKRVVVVALLIGSCLNLLAQDWAKATGEKPISERRLKVGDKIPFKELHNVINYKKKTLKFSDHKPKLIILDFWDTQCSPCIKFWPTALELQKEFGSDLLLIPVNKYQNEKEIKSFLAKRKRIDGTDMNLPMVCRDSTIWKNFPAEIYPNYVWISPDGVIGSIGYGKDMTRENIKKWITTGPFKMEQVDSKKIQPVTPWDPIFVNGNGGDRSRDVFMWSSSFSKGQEDLGTSMTIFDAESYPTRGYGVLMLNSPIIALYGCAYNNRLLKGETLDFLPLSRMELHTADTTKYYWDGTRSGNAYNYQLICGIQKTQGQVQELMQEDLKRYIGLDAKWEKRIKKCLVLKMFDSTLATKKKSLGVEAQLRDGKIILDSISLKYVVRGLETSTDYYRNKIQYPIIDETGYKGRITGLRENGKVYPVSEFNRVLAMVGLKFTFEMREVDVLVLREPDESN